MSSLLSNSLEAPTAEATVGSWISLLDEQNILAKLQTLTEQMYSPGPTLLQGNVINIQLFMISAVKIKPAKYSNILQSW